MNPDSDKNQAGNIELPEKFILRMKLILGSEYKDFYSALCKNPPYAGIRINTLKEGAREDVFSEFGELAPVPWCDDGFYADKAVINGKHPFHNAGLYYFQEPSAMCAVSALPIENGDRILDLCAAPGGKSTQAAAALNGSGLLVSNEISKKRAGILSENIERMGIKNAVVTNEPPQTLAEKYPCFFDKIIVDAPCSGEGMFRKEPQAITEWSEEHMLSCAERQKNILNSAFKMLKPGGYLVYSTCTFSEEENERNAEYISEAIGAELLPIPRLSMLSPGINMPSARRIFPHRQNGEGHFTALFKKRTEGAAEAPPKKRGKSFSPPDEAVRLYREFENEYLNTRLDGFFVLFGSSLYLMPCELDLDKIRTVRPGLHLGTLKKDRFLPAHALALALKTNEIKCVLECSLEAAYTYMRGNVIPFGGSGWCAAAYKNHILGWGKASGGILKNHFPKHMRIL